VIYSPPMTDMWKTVAAERGALADDLAGLSDEQWDTPSLNEEWTVRHTLAHITGTARTGPVGFLVGMVRAGFRFSEFTDIAIARHYGFTPAETLAGFRAIQGSKKAPPGPRTLWLGETIIHAEDIRRPLGISHDYPADAVARCLDFFTSSNMLIGTRRRIDGLSLAATDQDWQYGAGTAVRGRAIDLLMAATGRGTACASLTGSGISTLESRC
jgi:uncharacterized protein (TIGR03083 family)